MTIPIEPYDQQSLPIVMPANNTNAHRLEVKHPGRMGLLIGPSGWRDPKGLRFACDNDKYTCWSKGKAWDEGAFMTMLDKVEQCNTAPLWVVVPDEVGDAFSTFKLWESWSCRLRQRNLRLAMAVQDGMTPESVRGNADPDVIFVGGTTDWKRRTMYRWCREFEHVHVGRINTEKWLWNAHRCGAESTDGTGWFRGGSSRLRGLIRYLQRSDAGVGTGQLELEFARMSDGSVPKKSLVIQSGDPPPRLRQAKPRKATT